MLKLKKNLQSRQILEKKSRILPKKANKFNEKKSVSFIYTITCNYSVMINFVIENDWKWNHCRLPIKRSQKKCKKKQEEYFYQVINCEDTGPINEQKIKVALDRPFPFEPDTGFVWHKSWNLPEINVTMNEQQMCFFTDQYKEIGCQIMAVYPIKYSNSYYLNEITLEGNCFKTIHQNHTSFKFLKFGQTSFNHNRNKFCLLVWVYGQNSYKDRDDLFCLISSPIYVDSRKQARKKQMQSLSTVSIHSPKKFMSPIGGIKGSVSNSAQGFINYYGAQNIRNKIKHPFYIAYHFDKVFALYLNTQANASLVDTLNIIESSKAIEGSSSKTIEQNVIMLNILEPVEKNRKKIISIIEKWKFGCIEYSYASNYVPQPKWQFISKQDIKSSYKTHYENQISKQQKFVNKKQQNNELNGSEVENNEVVRNPNQKIDNSEQKSNEVQRQRNYQLRTIIDLSKPRKKVKLQE